MSATTMPPSLDVLINGADRGIVETSLDLHAIDQTENQETLDTMFLSPDIVTFQPESALSGLEEEMASWDPSWNILSNNLSHNDNDILESNQKQTESPSSQRRTSGSGLIPSAPDHDLLPSQSNDDSLVGLITVSKQKGWMGAFHIAAQRGHEQILRVLLQRGNTDVNQQDSDGRTPLLHAVMQNHEPVVRLLLTQGARIGILDCDGRSGIHWAVLRRKFSMLQMLLKHRDEYEPMLAIDLYDNTGWTALHMAVFTGFEPAMLLLMQLGADINAKAHKCPFQK
jgi:ankyrin repeat protein